MDLAAATVPLGRPLTRRPASAIRRLATLGGGQGRQSHRAHHTSRPSAAPSARLKIDLEDHGVIGVSGQQPPRFPPRTGVTAGIPEAEKNVGDRLGGLGRHWGWLLFFGVLMVAAGVCAVAWPGPTVVVLAVLFGIQIIVSGIFSFINAFAATSPAGCGCGM